MATVTLKGVPDDLLSRLKREAADHRRSLNGEVIYRLELSVSGRSDREELAGISTYQPRPAGMPAAVNESTIDVADWLERVEALRKKMNVRTTVDEIIAARDEGRR